VLIPNFAGDDELVVLHRSYVVDQLEDLRALIFGEVEPRNLQVWPEVFDDQHKAKVIGLIHSMEGELKGCLHLDCATEIVGGVPFVVLGLVEVRRNYSREVIGHEVLENS
jgi:hypothetical protein